MQELCGLNFLNRLSLYTCPGQQIHKKLVEVHLGLNEPAPNTVSSCGGLIQDTSAVLEYPQALTSLKQQQDAK